MDGSTPSWVIIGKFGRPQGIKGLIRVNSFTTPPENILQYPDWFIQKQGTTWQRVERQQDSFNPQRILAQIDGYASREAVAELTNVNIAVPETALPVLDDDEYYWHELIGMTVLHHTGVPMGVVDSVLETGANDVLVVIDKPENQPHQKRLIPYLLDQVIQHIDKQSREITVDWDLDF